MGIIAIANPQHERGSTGYPSCRKGKAHDDSFNGHAGPQRTSKGLQTCIALPRGAKTPPIPLRRKRRLGSFPGASI
ncbi:hypothetical protein JTE90_024456 [Oedothorax gibbosus]|uniref:Uncharacterized protein n=1 Tax=Oedothorax gibbosus TaxID=931172 RepID=A0AAV6TJQ1_9ARAC|nr:hypothetical protein JTE90_024456 [Oedothorax gibbosus]